MFHPFGTITKHRFGPANSGGIKTSHIHERRETNKVHRIIDYSSTTQDLHLASCRASLSTCRALCTSNTWHSACTALVADALSGCT